MIERQIIIAAVTNTDYLREVRELIKPNFIQASSARILLGWCTEYFDKHGKAPGQGIETIFYEHLSQKKLSKEVASELEEEILPGLSKEYENTTEIDLPALVDATKTYFREQGLQSLRESLTILLEKGRMEEAETLVTKYRQQEGTPKDEVILNSPESPARMVEALERVYEPLVEYPGALGKFWNHQLVRGGFVALLSPEKRGKSIMKLDLAMRASSQGRPTAFIQAGDMTTDQQLKRIASYLLWKPIDERYTGTQYLPCQDCIKNQLNLCQKEIRECQEGLLEEKGWNEEQLRYEVDYKDLVQAVQNYPNYKPCYNCQEWHEQAGHGAVYLQKTILRNTLSVQEAERAVQEYFVKKNKPLRIRSFSNGTLTVDGLRRVLDEWAGEGFVPEVLVLDYADLIEDFKYKEERHKQNAVWKQLRGINQELNCLLVTSSQADASSYDRDTLSLKNFSEDKRKYSHCTAFYGLNQDRSGREKKLGIMRINELLLREGDFDSARHCYVLQNMVLGRPVVGSYF